ncbi:hypothetical protein OGM63_16200 [Plectonema radiosum NIES-515]|uniref:Uncharacterized protein n=1 Tax=Plectonema radiosum NIES-515 TaxID=2986073 RepID=A0ABT3B1B4_9CYAN|nr:hypothetical protein [Plectonema radiosum]MCV3215035.1 hypothetical protein [Plectonema radiosum NIES-515]
MSYIKPHPRSSAHPSFCTLVLTPEEAALQLQQERQCPEQLAERLKSLGIDLD